MIVHLRRAPEALIPLDIFRNEVVGTATAAIFFSMFAFIGSTVYLPIYFEFVIGKDSTAAGAGLIALVGGSVVGATIAGRTCRASSITNGSRSSAWFSRSPRSLRCRCSPPASISGRRRRWCWRLDSASARLFPTATVSVQNAVDQRDLGVATATLAFLRTFGSAIGVALMGAVIIGFGVVTDAGVPQSRRRLDPDLAKRAGAAFAVMFALQAAALAISLGCFLLMEERPLRGAAPSAARARRMIAA